jgi:hypothetical protein
MSRDRPGRRTPNRQEQKNAGQKNEGETEQPYFSARRFSVFSDRR